MSRQELIEIANLTQLFLLQEYQLSDWIFAEADSYAFFKRLATAQKKQTEPPVQPIGPGTIENRSVAPSPAPRLQPPGPRAAETLQPPAPAAPKIIQQQPVPQDPPQPQKQASPPGATQEVKGLPKEDRVAAKDSGPEKKSILKLEPMEPAKPIDFTELRAIIAERFPGFKILDDIPDDSKAKIKSNRRKQVQAAVIFSQTIPQHQAFLENLAAAIDICLAPAIVVNAAKLEKEQDLNMFLSSPALKLIIISQMDLQKIPALAAQNKIQLVQLNDIGMYLKDPAQKKLLWESLETRIM